MMNFLSAKIAFFGPSQCVSSIEYFYTGNNELDRSMAVILFNFQPKVHFQAWFCIKPILLHPIAFSVVTFSKYD